MEHKLDDAVGIVRLTPQNSRFFITENGFLMIDTELESVFFKEPAPSGAHSHGHGGNMPPPPGGGPGGPPMPQERHDAPPSDEHREKKPLVGKRRVFLHRAFPFDRPYEFISVSDDNGEIGIIYDLGDFADAKDILKNELDSKYFAPKIQKITSLKERFGYSYWKVKCDRGDYEFTVKDTFRSIIHVSEDRVFVLDVDSNRFEIESLSSLDKNSFRKIELYI